MIKLTDVTGIILAGGESRRMGTNKALLQFEGRTLTEVLIEKLKSVFKHVIISARNERDFISMNVPVISDKFSQMGPIAGIYSSLIESPTQKNFFIPCDMPLISVEMIGYFAEYRSVKNIIIPRTQEDIHFTCGIFTKECVEPMRVCLSKEGIVKSKSGKNKCSVKSIIESIGAEIIDVTELPFYTPEQFFNLNTPSDYLSLPFNKF